LGKAIAAHLPEDRVRAILEAEGMPRLAPRTITDPEEYLRELRTVSAVGYAVDERENEPEGRCLAVPILGYHVPAAISLSAPQSRFPADRIKEAATEFGGAARRIAEDLAYTG
jgi:IclR family acetate operon transcriptional repressor